MIKVYYETKGYAELVAEFGDESTYLACYKALQRDAISKGFLFVTESMGDDEEPC